MHIIQGSYTRAVSDREPVAYLHTPNTLTFVGWPLDTRMLGGKTVNGLLPVGLVRGLVFKN